MPFTIGICPITIESASMKIILRLLLVAAIAFSLPACRFKEAIFTEGFSQVDPDLGGVWAARGENGDPRKTEFAVCAPLDADRLLLHYPSGGKEGIYFEAKAIKVREQATPAIAGARDFQ